MDADRIQRLFRELERHQVDYVVFGGVAINLHGLARNTDDIDLFIDPTPRNVERLRAALRAIWDDPELDQLSAAELAGDYPAVQYGPPGEDFQIDIVARLGSAFRYADLEHEEHDVAGVPVRVATPRTLYRMKRDTVRLRDRADAAMLRERFDLDDEEA